VSDQVLDSKNGLTGINVFKEIECVFLAFWSNGMVGDVGHAQKASNAGMQLATHTGDSALRPELKTRGNMGSIGWLVLGSAWVAVAVVFAFPLSNVLRSAPKSSPRRKRVAQLAAFWS
jgi:hypothetical protein